MGTRDSGPTRVLPRGEQLVDDATRLADLRPMWDGLERVGIDNDPDYFTAVLEVAPDAERPYVVHVHGDHDSLLVARITCLRRSLGPIAMRTRTMVVTFDGVLGADGSEDLTRLRDALVRPVDDGLTSQARVQKVDVTSSWFAVLGDLARRRHLVTKATPHWRTDLPSSWDALLQERSTKSRRQIRYDDNKLRRAYGERLTLRRLHLPEHQHRLVHDVPEVAAASYQSQLGVSLVDDGVQAALLERARAAGWLRTWMLYIDERPVAFWWGVVRNATLAIGTPGFVPDLTRDRVGLYTLRRMLEDACADEEIRAIDWGPGPADYKERFGTSVRQVADVLIVPDTPRGWARIGFLRLRAQATSVARDWATSLDLPRRRKRFLRAIGARQ